MFQRSALGDQQLPNGVVVASFETYDQAQSAIAKVSSSDTELAGLAIIGNDLKLVERIVGRLTWGKVATRGAIRGLGFGAFLGLMFLVFVPEAVSSVLVFPLLGLAFGILLAVVQHAVVRRKRDFASTQQVLAARYDVVAPRESAGKAMHVIGQRGGSAPSEAQLQSAPPPQGQPQSQGQPQQGQPQSQGQPQQGQPQSQQPQSQGEPQPQGQPQQSQGEPQPQGQPQQGQPQAPQSQDQPTSAPGPHERQDPPAS